MGKGDVIQKRSKIAQKSGVIIQGAQFGIGLHGFSRGFKILAAEGIWVGGGGG
jgi:hypothetical protein